MKLQILRISIFSNKFADLWMYHFYYCICIILNLFMIFVNTYNMKMRNSQKGTVLCIKHLIIITFFHKFLKFCYRKTIRYFFELIFATHFVFLKWVSVQNIFKHFANLGHPPKRVWQGHAHFLFFSFRWKMVERFCVVLFA